MGKPANGSTLVILFLLIATGLMATGTVGLLAQETGDAPAAPPAGGAALPEAEPTAEDADAPPATAEPSSADASSAPALWPVRSQAERIAALVAGIEDAEEKLQALRENVRQSQQEFDSATTIFRTIDERYQTLVDRLEEAEQQGDQQALEQARSDLADLAEIRDLARQRLDLALQTRRNLQEQVPVVEQKLEQDRQALERLTTPDQEEPADAQTPAVQETPAPQSTPPPTADAPAPTLPTLPTLPQPAPQPEPASPTPDPTAVEPPSEEVRAAQEAAEQAQKEADRAAEVLATVQQRVQTLEKELELKRDALRAVRLQVENAEKTRETLTRELNQRREQGEAEDILARFREGIASSNARYDQAVAEAQRLFREIDGLQNQRAILLAEQVDSLRTAEQARQEAEEKLRAVEYLQNPLAPRNVANWLVTKGPKILAIFVVALVLHFLLWILRPRIVYFSLRKSRRGEKKDRKGRAQTIVDTFYTTATAAIYLLSVLMALDVAGVPVAPLLGGAAVAGLAVAFAAQNLIKDYFNGLMILLEDQYVVGDVVRITGSDIPGIAGGVERITLRMTVLRDLEGTLHFIPHGNVSTVSNLSHGWSRVMVDLRVAYKEDPNQVMEVIKELGREMHDDPDYGELFLDDLEMLGVDNLTESAVIIKFLIKTQPLQQWVVKREFLRRLERRFAQLGIEIPFPHRTIVLRHATDQNQYAEIPYDGNSRRKR